jgi:uncharacterized coiled-coil DUF342 family protein
VEQLKKELRSSREEIKTLKKERGSIASKIQSIQSKYSKFNNDLKVEQLKPRSL